MYTIGDLYNNDKIKGVVISVDSSNEHGLIISLYEAYLNWYEAEKWCQNFGDGWFMPSRNNLKAMENNVYLQAIQHTLLFHGIPLHFGSKSSPHFDHGHIYWTKDFYGHHDFCKHDWMHVFCLDSNGFSSYTSDSKDRKHYIRAVHKF